MHFIDTDGIALFSLFELIELLIDRDLSHYLDPCVVDLPSMRLLILSLLLKANKTLPALVQDIGFFFPIDDNRRTGFLHSIL